LPAFIRKAQLLAPAFSTAGVRVLKYPFAVCHRGHYRKQLKPVLRSGRTSAYGVSRAVKGQRFHHVFAWTGAAAQPRKPSAAQNRFTCHRSAVPGGVGVTAHHVLREHPARFVYRSNVSSSLEPQVGANFNASFLDIMRRSSPFVAGHSF